MHPCHPRAFRLRRVVLAGALTTAVCACAVLLATCGGSSGGASAAASASPSPAPVPSPQITSGEPPAAAVDAVRSFWTLVGEGKLAEAKHTLVAPGSTLLQWSDEQDGIASARFVGVVPHSVARGPAPEATIEFGVDVRIGQAPDEPVLWGDLGEHRLFEQVVRMSDGTWRMWDSGTGP
jgi:hypothetical protein